MWLRNQVDTGNQVLEAAEDSKVGTEVLYRWDTTTAGVDIEAGFGRGVADTDRTYVKLKRSDGTAVYIYVDTGTTVVCSTTQP